MNFCKEQEICKPFECRKASCSIGEELRNLSESFKCKENCNWIKQGVNGINSCKDISCPTENIIVDFRKK